VGARGVGWEITTNIIIFSRGSINHT